MLNTDDAIRARKTTKVLAQQPLPVDSSVKLVNELLAAAGMAPFHRACDEWHRMPPATLSGIEPWRFHALDTADCRRLRERIPLEKAGKIPAMLAVADALLLATWLPNPDANFERSSEHLFEPTLANMEHVAAASAAIQNLLLAASARQIPNYWSSGGVLRSAPVFELLSIPQTEILLGAIFLFPNNAAETGIDAEVVGSKLRDKRTPVDRWSRWLHSGITRVLCSIFC